jgi:hypothetical protein
MEWVGVENNCVRQSTKHGTARAHSYYYVWETKEGKWIAGRYWFSREIDFGRKVFSSAEKARAYCEAKDREAVIIEEARA